MNAEGEAAAPALTLVEIVELKWLLAGEGVHVHVERLQADAGYADATLTRAAQSVHPTVRSIALRLRQRLAGG